MASSFKQVVVYTVVILTVLINTGVAGAFTSPEAESEVSRSLRSATVQGFDLEIPNPDATSSIAFCDGLCVVTTVPCGAACPLMGPATATASGLSLYSLLKFPVTARLSKGLEHNLDPHPPKTGA